MARPRIAVTLAGVAIAAALVPPLAVVGIALTNDRFEIALNAAILVTTNVIAITLGAAWAFRMLGVNGPIIERLPPAWARVFNVGLLLAMVALAFPLTSGVIEVGLEGQDRPHSFPLSTHTRRAIRQFLSQHPHHRLIKMARDSIEPHGQILILLESSKPATARFDRELK